MKISIAGEWFQDEQGRRLHLRGVNLGGSSKVPVQPNGATHLRAGFFEHRAVSFVGRPFPLSEADTHFKRLKTWGLTFIRLLTPWEAIEHSGPGQYDEAYLDYIRTIVQKAAAYDCLVFIDPHQDVWSRFSGGDGAPGWTLEAVGFDLTRFHATGAALVHQTHGDPFPRMTWPSNYTKLATATMFTLFFGGNDFAPATQIEGVPAQDYLQGHYFKAIQQVAARLSDLPNVLGYDTLNEPHRGYIGWGHLAEQEARLKIGMMPTPYQAMLLGAGYAQEVTEWLVAFLGTRAIGQHRIDPQGQQAWRQGVECLWRQNGVWDVAGSGEPVLLRPHHFTKARGKPVNFMHDYLIPFAQRFAAAVRAVHPGAFIFFEGDAISGEHAFEWQPPLPGLVYAPHWYDGLTLFTKRYNPALGLDVSTMRPVLGAAAVRRSFTEQVKRLRAAGSQLQGGVPTVIGETGIPFDMHNQAAYRTGDYSAQMQALDATLSALEGSLVNFTLWNYTADNSHTRGDLWNGEDLSLYSPDDRQQPEDIHSGGRALAAAIRPYARATAGTPIKCQYDLASGVFQFSFWHDPASTAPTELFVPNYQYPTGYRVEVTDGEYEIDSAHQRLLYRPTDKQIPHSIRIFPTPPRPSAAEQTPVRRALAVLVIGFVVWRFWRWLRRP